MIRVVDENVEIPNVAELIVDCNLSKPLVLPALAKVLITHTKDVTWIQNLHQITNLSVYLPQNAVPAFGKLRTLAYRLEKIIPFTLPHTINTLNVDQNTLSSVQGFPKSLQHLTCVYCADISNVPDELECMEIKRSYVNNITFPKKLKTLIIINSQFFGFDHLSPDLLLFKCYNTSFIEVDFAKHLPENLIHIDLNRVSWPVIKNLPKLLKTLIVENCHVTTIQELPEGLENLFCALNQLQMLPALPESLKKLFCTSNYITKLPQLPGNLQDLDCCNNELDSLPSLPDTLTYLNCGINHLKNIPVLPEKLKQLVCSHNLLDSLPVLPESLQKLHCVDARLWCLPHLPKTLTKLTFERNYIPFENSREVRIFQRMQKIYQTELLKTFVAAWRKKIMASKARHNLEVTETIKSGSFLDGKVIGVYRQDPDFIERWK